MNILIPSNKLGLGDCVMLLPLIDTIHHTIPHSKIHILCPEGSPAFEIFSRHEHVDQVSVTPPSSKKYDLLLCHYMSGDLRTMTALIRKLKLKNPQMKVIQHLPHSPKRIRWLRKFLAILLGIRLVTVNYHQHNIQNFLNLLAPLNLSEDKFILKPVFPPSLIKMAKEETKSLKLPPSFWLVQPGASHASKTPKKWPLSHWNALLQLLVIRTQSKGFILGSKAEEILLEELNKFPEVMSLIGKTSIMTLIGILDSADFVVVPDSGIAHMASALNKKTLVLWGPSQFTLNRPIGENTRVLHQPFPCAPCINPLDGKNGEERAYERCPRAFACMQTLSPDLVMAELSSLKCI